MTDALPTNPLEVLGVPKWVVLQKGQDLAFLRDIAKWYYRSLSKGFHTDKSDSERAIQQAINDAWDDIQSDVGLQVAITWYIGGAEKAAAAIQLFARHDRQRSNDLLRAAAAMLPFVDPRHVLGPEPREFAVGMSSRLGVADAPDLIHLLTHTGQSQVKLASVVIPGLTSTNVTSWDAKAGRWLTEQFVFGDDVVPNSVKPVHYGTPTPQGEVAIVGTVPLAPLYEMYANLEQKKERLALGILATPGRHDPFEQKNNKLEWLPFNSAWWLRFLEPQYRPDTKSYLVVARGAGENLRLALLGYVLNSRPL